MSKVFLFFGGRKMFLAISVLIIASIGWFASGLINVDVSTDEFFGLVRWVLGIYLVGNVGYRVAEREKPKA